MKSEKQNEKPSPTKPVLTRLKPSMSREEKVQNLLNALEKQGIVVKPSPKE